MTFITTFKVLQVTQSFINTGALNKWRNELSLQSIMAQHHQSFVFFCFTCINEIRKSFMQKYLKPVWKRTLYHKTCHTLLGFKCCQIWPILHRNTWQFVHSVTNLDRPHYFKAGLTAQLRKVLSILQEMWYNTMRHQWPSNDTITRHPQYTCSPHDVS
jgi:hypothetical protein